MRKTLSVLFLIVALGATSASAAPRRDDQAPGFLERIVLMVKRVVHTLDDVRAHPPLP